MTNRDDDVLDAKPDSQSEAMEETAMTRGVPWEVEIDIHLKKGCPDPEFEISTPLPRDPNGNIIFLNNHRPGFNIKFNLHDDTHSGYTFPGQAHVRDGRYGLPHVANVGSLRASASGQWYDPDRLQR